MAIKDFNKYYDTISSQLFALQEVFDDIQKEVNNGMVPPERLEGVEQTIKPIKETYQILSYVKYLLNMPTRKEKRSTFSRQNKKLLKACGNKTDLVQDNYSRIKSLKK